MTQKLSLSQILAKQKALKNPLPKPTIVAASPLVAKPSARILDPHSPETSMLLSAEVIDADLESKRVDKILDRPNPAVIAKDSEENISGRAKMDRLVEENFPFDDSQLSAINGIIEQQYAAMTGAAGTGKTTVTKGIVDKLQDLLDTVDMSTYWKSKYVSDDKSDSYDMPEDRIPSIALVSFTGRATQMIKKNFPKSWHGNIMTIHRMLGFVPEYYEGRDDSGQLVKKRRFVPSYTADNKTPWDIIVIDEAGMLGLELWHQLWAATQSHTRIIMIGDINQLPPTHGKSIFGFAMSDWPTWELTHIHRQKGANNSIVDNAHRVLKGLRPVSDCKDPAADLMTSQGMLAGLNFMVKDKDWRFMTLNIDETPSKASMNIRKMLKLLQGRMYEPNRDCVITPINGHESTSSGAVLGQEPMNRELAILLNSDSPRWFIDAGRDRKNFAVGDKVMATKNDYETGITNGMTGIITKIVENGGYVGDSRRFGLISEVGEYLSGLRVIEDEDSDDDFSLTAINDFSATYEEKKEEKHGGPASHIVTVQFGDEGSETVIDFSNKAEVESLMLAYVVTCHKMQGGEAPLVFIVCHQAHKMPLNREWLYTAITRASHRVVLLQTKQGVGTAISKQSIKGINLKAKIASFQRARVDGGFGASVKVLIPRACPIIKMPPVVTHEPTPAPVPAAPKAAFNFAKKG